jgi:ATP-GRASP peptide maturase of grasp-with-spasm system
MILIFSESNDTTTSQVIEWLLPYNTEVLRLNECDKLINIQIQKKIILLEFHILATNKDILVNLDDIKMTWHRKGGFNIKYWLEEQSLQNKLLDEYMKHELRIVMDYISFMLTTKKNLANVFNSSMNKLHVNFLANEIGLLTPDFIIATRKDNIEAFLDANENECITKAISETFYIAEEAEQIVISYTEQVSKSDLTMYAQNIKPTLLQEKINKAYELRIFYLNGICYASAIFSQNDAQTKVDFRKYNYIKPNRTVPFNLPDDISTKIHLLMKKVNLKTGSIDMLVTEKQEYIFLEINPVGQFGMVSSPCNYYLEEKVAHYLQQKN